MYSRHPDPRRVWKGGSEQHLLTPLPRAPRASSKKLYVAVFYSVFEKCLFLCSVKGYMLLCFTMILWYKSQERYFFRKKAPAAVHHTHTGHKKLPINRKAAMYLFRTENMGYILCSKHIHASHICPPKRNRSLKQRKWKLSFSGKHGLWPANYISKSLFWWKPEIIPRSLWSFCPKRFPHKTPIEVQCLTKVLKSIFPKVWDSLRAQYEII